MLCNEYEFALKSGIKLLNAVDAFDGVGLCGLVKLVNDTFGTAVGSNGVGVVDKIECGN